MTGILFDSTTGTWNVFVDRTEDQLCAGGVLQPQQALQVLEQAMQCSLSAQEGRRQVRVRAMRRFYGIATTMGLDTSAGDPMRSALSDFMGRTLMSRKQLTAFEWMVCGDAVRAGVLFWSR